MMKVGINEKTMQINKENDIVKIIFCNNQEEEMFSKGIISENFNVFVKNIGPDNRSRLSNDTKIRLWNFIHDIRISLAGKEILEDYLKEDKIYLLDERFIFKIIPELEKEVGFEQKSDYHIYDVWEHTLKALEKSDNDLEIRLALLLHDIGKLHKYQDDGDIRHFKGHAQESAKIAKDILTRLGYEEKQIEDICYLIANHAKTINVDDVNKDNLEITKKLLHIQYCDAYGYNPKYLRDVLDKLDVIYKKLEVKEKQINNQENEGER